MAVGFDPKKHTLMCLYDNCISYYFEDIEECAKELFNFKIIKEDNSWKLYELGKLQGRSWATIEEHGGNGYTYEECVREYLNFFIDTHKCKNLKFFKLVE